MTQDIHEVITQDLLDYNTLRSVLEPLHYTNLHDQNFYTPIGVILEDELQEIQLRWSPTYLPYYIEDTYIPPTSEQIVQTYLRHFTPRNDIDEEWNIPYPTPQTKYSYTIPDIWNKR